MNNQFEVVLEESTNTHLLKSTGTVESKRFTNGDVALNITTKRGTVHHGEHGTIATEARNVLKTVQQELNPITQKMQAAFD